MVDFTMTEQIIIDITTVGKKSRNTAKLIIDKSEIQGISFISPAILQIENDGQTAELHMTADELGEIARMFLDQVEKMK